MSGSGRTRARRGRSARGTESHSPTVANHLVFEADARIVRAQASKILAARALLPTVNQAAYKQMLYDFITGRTCSSPVRAAAPHPKTTPLGTRP